MSFEDRLANLLVGAVIGGIIGYLTAMWRVRRMRNAKDPTKATPYAAFTISVLLTLYAVVSTQVASNKVADTQGRLDQVSTCNSKYLTKTIGALGQRTTYNRARNEANLRLQQAQIKYTEVVLDTLPDDPERRTALQMYVRAQKSFVNISDIAQETTEGVPYPTTSTLSSCYRK